MISQGEVFRGDEEGEATEEEDGGKGDGDGEKNDRPALGDGEVLG